MHTNTSWLWLGPVKVEVTYELQFTEADEADDQVYPAEVIVIVISACINGEEVSDIYFAPDVVAKWEKDILAERLDEVQWQREAFNGRSIYDDPTDADARLIAAAPDFLTGGIKAAGALPGAMTIMRELSQHPTAQKLEEMLSPLLAAIKKATAAGDAL